MKDLLLKGDKTLEIYQQKKRLENMFKPTLNLFSISYNSSGPEFIGSLDFRIFSNFKKYF